MVLVLKISVRFEVCTVVKIQLKVFWVDTTQCCTTLHGITIQKTST